MVLLLTMTLLAIGYTLLAWAVVGINRQLQTPQQDESQNEG